MSFFFQRNESNLNIFKGTIFNGNGRDLCIRNPLTWFLLPVSLLQSEETWGVVWDDSEIWDYPKEVIHRYLKTSLHGPFRSLNNGGVFSDLKMTSWGCFLQLLRLPGINGKSQTGQKVCPSHVVEEFKVEFQFLDLRGIQKTNKYILKDSVMWLAVFFSPPGHSPTCLCYTESHCNEMFLLSTGRSFSPGKKRKCLFVLYGSP